MGSLYALQCHFREMSQRNSERGCPVGFEACEAMRSDAK